MKKIFAAFIALGVAGSAQAQSADAIMNRAVSAYAGMKSVRAEFSQTITNPLTGTTASSSGVLLRKDPAFLSINFTNPKGDRVVADGTNLWIYLPSSAPNQVIRTSARSNESLEMVDPAGVFLSSPASRYTITSGGSGTVKGRKMNILNLVPKSKNGMFTRARLWIDASDNMLRQFELVDINGLTRVVTITSIKPNAAIPSSSFKFTAPKNARIVGPDAMGG
jgi:outer membrane lipoprotein carrier protein